MNVAKMDGRFETWRCYARGFLQSETPPERIQWLDERENYLFEDAPEDLLRTALINLSAMAQPAARVPKEFIPLAQAASCFRGPKRWPLLYEILWRLTHGEPKLLEISVDASIAELRRMEKAVRRDVHKMKAFVRFREISRGKLRAFIAWYEPDHLIVERAAPFFARRFGDQVWAILTPDRCVAWEVEASQLHFFDGLTKREVGELWQDDSTEELWQLYYAHIFNPARMKLKAMKAEMPLHFWKNLPETQLIPELIKNAETRLKGFKLK